MSCGLCDHLGEAKVIYCVQENVIYMFQGAVRFQGGDIFRPCEFREIEISKEPDVAFCLFSLPLQWTDGTLTSLPVYPP